MLALLDRNERFFCLVFEIWGGGPGATKWVKEIDNKFSTKT